MKKFYTKFNEDYLLLNKKSVELQPYEIVIDGIYAVLNQSDETYYRGQVIDFCPKDQVKIFLIDYGDDMEIDRQQIYKLLPPFDKEPDFALNCFINGND